jgi:Tfp pilus assembly protein PilF
MSTHAPRVGALLFVAAGAFLASLTELSDWDTFHHLAYGRDILQRGGFAPEDPFLYPLAGQPSGPPPSWLASVVIYLSWLAAGDPGPVYLAGVLGAALFVLLFSDAVAGDRSVAGLVTALVPLSFALAVFRERAVARPELFAYVLLAWTLIALRRHAKGRGYLVLTFPVAAVLWANLHQSVLLGIAMPLAFIVVNGALLGVRRSGGRLPTEVPGGWALVAPTGALLGGLAAVSLLNPSGVAPLGSPLYFIQAVIARAPGAGTQEDPLSLLSRLVDELRPPTEAQWLGPFGWLVLLCAVSFVLAWRRLNLRELVMCGALVYLGASAQRFMVLAAIVMAPVAARNLRAALAHVPMASVRPVRWGVIGVAALGVSIAGWSMFHIPGIRFGTGLARQVPVRAVEYLKSIGFEGRLFNTFHFGGYLEWTLGQKVFQDGRGHLLPDDARAAYAGPSAYARFATLDSRYRFDALVTHYPQFTDAGYSERVASAPGADWGADRATWALVAFDDGGQVYLRRDGRYAAFAAGEEYRHAMPANSLAAPQPGDRGGLRQDLERSLREVPDCLRCRTMLGFLLNEQGRPEEAEDMLWPATEGLPETQLFALLGLVRAAEQRGDRAAAVARWRRIIELAPDPSWSRRQLAGLLLRYGDPGAAWSEVRKNLGAARERVDDLELGARIAQARGDARAVSELSSRLAAARALERAGQLYRAGRALMEAGRLPEAVAALRHALQLNERTSGAHFALGQAYELLGQPRPAGAAYRRYLELEPGGRWAQEARDRLAGLERALP